MPRRTPVQKWQGWLSFLLGGKIRRLVLLRALKSKMTTGEIIVLTFRVWSLNIKKNIPDCFRIGTSSGWKWIWTTPTKNKILVPLVWFVLFRFIIFFFFFKNFQTPPLSFLYQSPPPPPHPGILVPHCEGYLGKGKNFIYTRYFLQALKYLQCRTY